MAACISLARKLLQCQSPLSSVRQFATTAADKSRVAVVGDNVVGKMVVYSIYYRCSQGVVCMMAQRYTRHQREYCITADSS